MLSAAMYSTVVSSSLYDTQRRECALIGAVHSNWGSLCAPWHIPVSRLLHLLCTHQGCHSYCAHTEAARITVHTQRELQLLCTHKDYSNYCAHIKAIPITVHTQRLPQLLCTQKVCRNYCAHIKATPITVHTQSLLQLLCNTKAAPITVHT